MGCGCSDTIKTCCDVCDCMDLDSSNNTVTIERTDTCSQDGCKFDLTITPNNIDNLLTINNGECITFVKEFIDGKLVLTPVIDWECVAGYVCEICNPVTDCPAPTGLEVAGSEDEV